MNWPALAYAAAVVAGLAFIMAKEADLGHAALAAAAGFALGMACGRWPRRQDKDSAD